MANENAPIGQINPAHLIGQVQVQPNAAAQMIDAFRSGVVTVDDIIKGIERHDAAKTQQAAADMALREASSPVAVQARQTAQQLALAQGQSALELNPLQQQAAQEKLNTFLMSSKWTQAGFSPEILNTLISEGFSIPLDKVPDETSIAAARAALDKYQKFHRAKAWSVEALKGGKADFEPKTGQLITTWQPVMGQQLSDTDREEARRVIMSKNAATWDGSLPRAFSGMAPGQAVTPTVAPRPGEGTVLAPAPAVEARRPVVGSVTTAPGLSIQQVTAPMAPEGKAPTETQQRAILALSRFAVSDPAMAKLEASGFRPNDIAGLVFLNRFWPNYLTPQDWQTYEAARQSWAQGVLRLESGAAISAREEAWYKKAFFPQPGDSDSTMTVKEQLRRNLEESVAKVAQAGPIPEELRQQVADDLRKIEAAAEVYTVDPSKGKAAPAAKPVVVGGVTYTRNADGTYTATK